MGNKIILHGRAGGQSFKMGYAAALMAVKDWVEEVAPNYIDKEEMTWLLQDLQRAINSRLEEI